MAILSKSIYRLSAIPIKIPILSFSNNKNSEIQMETQKISNTKGNSEDYEQP